VSPANVQKVFGADVAQNNAKNTAKSSHLEDFKSTFHSPDRSNRRKIAREVARFYDDVARAAGFTPAERRTAWAITTRLYERAGEACDTPRGISLASIGEALTSRSDDDNARTASARRHVGDLFNHSIPRAGYQILTRFKAEEDSGKPHEYADHLLPVADLFSELLAEEIEKILAFKGLDKEARKKLIAEARERLIAEALEYLPKCEAEILTPEGEVYARLSEPEAKAFCSKNKKYIARPYKWSPPPADPPPRPLCDADFKRLKERAVRLAVDQLLDEIAERNTPEEARLFWRSELLPAIQRAGASWSKVFGSVGGAEEEVEEDLKHGTNLSGVAPPDQADFDVAAEGAPPDKLSGVQVCNSADSDDLEKLKNNKYENHIDEIAPDQAPEPERPTNFDSALEAAEFYARDGWPVLPICQFDPATGRCTADWHPETCTGKKPLVKGNGRPGEGYTAATTDLQKIRHWFGVEYQDAGVGLRLDGKVLIDADLKDGGPASYEYLRDTFDLPPTLTAITQGGGRHFVFRLTPEQEELLKSWTRVLDKIALPGIDLKVGKCGLLYAEPTRGAKGVYRWVDPTAEIAALPHEAAEFFKSIRFKEDRKREEKAPTTRTYTTPAAFDYDQEKFFRDAPRGSRRPRLFGIAVAIRKQTGAGADQIAEALRYHAARFTEPLDDPGWIEKTARQVAQF
jgi:hypothetical protein